MMRALAITVLGFTVAAVSMNIILKHNRPDDTKTVVIELPNEHIKFLEEDKPKEAVLKKQHSNTQNKQMVAAKANVAAQRHVPPVPTNEPVLTDVKPIDLDKAIASVDNIGDDKSKVGNVTTPIGVGPKTNLGTEGTSDGDGPVEAVGLDVMPEPYGGAAAWAKFLQKNLRYPDTELQGRVVISFIIERDGKLTDLNIVKGVDNLLDREALRVLKLAPAWKPGQQNGKPVRVKYTIPIVFQMNEQ
jgi:protein TonB